MPHYRETKYGFECGPVYVERTVVTEKFGVWITLQTKKESITIRATPSGLLRVGDVEKRKKKNARGKARESGPDAQGTTK